MHSSVIIYMGSTWSTAVLCWQSSRRAVLFSLVVSHQNTLMLESQESAFDALRPNGVAPSSGGIQLLMFHLIGLSLSHCGARKGSPVSLSAFCGDKKKWLTSGFRAVCAETSSPPLPECSGAMFHCFISGLAVP